MNTIAILSGHLLGVLILLLTAQSLTFIDLTGSLVYTLVVPYAGIALALYYFDLQARQERSPPGEPVAPAEPSRLTRLTA